MKKIIFVIAMIILAFSINAYGQSNKRTIKKPIVKKTGICTGCCDPCYNDDVGNWRRHSKRKPKVKAIHRKRSKHK